MTLLATPTISGRVAAPEAAPPDGRPWLGLREHADIAALLLALGVLMGPVVRGGGGRDKHMLAVGLLALLPAVALGRVWRLGWRSVAVALGPGVGALVVCATAPMGWAGAGDVARFLYAGLLFLAVRSIVTTPERRILALVAISIGGLYQFDQAYLSWWGRGDASHAMSGTFYASNVFGAYMAGTGLSAMALAVAGPTRLRLVGWIAAPFCLSAAAFSSSRATIALTVGAFGLAFLLLVDRRSWRQAGRCAGVLLAAGFLASLLSSSLLMSQPAGLFAGASSKSNSASQTLDSSGGFRIEWWRAAAQVGMEHPLSGAGFGSFGAAESRFQPADSERSIYAHNVVLQSWADGGTALALPVGLALLGIGLAALRRARRREAAALAGILAVGVMGAHTLVDFDAQYPACLALACVVAGLAAAVPRGMSGSGPRSGGRWTAAAVVALFALSLLAAVRFDAAEAQYRRGQIAGGAWTGADGPFRDARFDVLRLRKGSTDAALLDRTIRLQDDNAEVTWTRARRLAAAGRFSEARHLAAAGWRLRAARQPAQVIGYAEVLVAVGEPDAAAKALVGAFRQSVARPTSGDLPLQLLDALIHTAGLEVAACLAPQLPSRLEPARLGAPAPSCDSTLRSFQIGADS